MAHSVRRASRLALALGLAAALAACQSSQQSRPTADRSAPTPQARTSGVKAPATPLKPLQPVRTGPVVVALLAPLSGDFADAGRDLSNGAAMALFDAPGPAAEILAFDTKGEAGVAAQMLDQAVAAKADIVIGPLFGRNAASLASKLAEHGLTALAFSNDGGVAGANVAVLGHTAEAETTRIVRHAASSGARMIAVFGKSDRVGAAVASQAEREAAAEGFYVRRALYSAEASYTDIARNVQNLVNARGRDGARRESANRLKAQLDGSDDPGAALARIAASRPGAEGAIFRGLAAFYAQMVGSGTSRPDAVNAVVTRYSAAGGLGGAGVDAVLLTARGAELSTIAPMFQLYDADRAGVRLIGLSGWADMDPTRARELHGGRFVLPPFEAGFDQRYERAYGAPPTELASVAYDAVRLALAAVKNGAPRPVPMAALIAAGDVDGAMGPVRMSETGIALRPLEVLEMTPGGFQPVEPARIIDPAAPVTPPPVAGAGS